MAAEGVGKDGIHGKHSRYRLANQYREKKKKLHVATDIMRESWDSVGLACILHGRGPLSPHRNRAAPADQPNEQNKTGIWSRYSTPVQFHGRLLPTYLNKINEGPMQSNSILARAPPGDVWTAVTATSWLCFLVHRCPRDPENLRGNSLTVSPPLALPLAQA